MTAPIRLLLVDDHPIFRESLRSLLDRQEDFQVVADAADGRAALAAVKQSKPDVVVMDISMPGMNGIDATQEIVSAQNAARVICLSIHRESGLVSAMLKAGASGYVLKSAAAHELPDAVRTVARGETYLCTKVRGDLVEQHVDRQKTVRSEAFADLTPREREVLQLLAEGHHTKSVAATLHISPKTVLVHRTSLMKKIGADGIVDLVRYAVRHGITQL